MLLILFLISKGKNNIEEIGEKESDEEESDEGESDAEESIEEDEECDDESGKIGDEDLDG